MITNKKLSLLSRYFVAFFGIAGIWFMQHNFVPHSIKKNYIDPGIPSFKLHYNLQEVENLGRLYLQNMKVKEWQFIKIELTDQGCHAFDRSIHINKELGNLGPLDFLIAHECAHIACNHCLIRSSGISLEEMKEQEKEADLLATQTLYSLNKLETIYQRIANLQFWSDERMKDDEIHPTAREGANYITQFLRDKGIKQSEIHSNVTKYQPFIHKMYGIKK